MKSPITGKEMVLRREPRNLTFRKEEFEVMYHYYLDEDNREQFTTDELDEINLNQLHNQYRERHNIPFTDEIVSIREKYGLHASKMSEILGFGANVYRNYEKGEVPNESNGNLIRLVQDTRQFLTLLQQNATFDSDTKAGLLERIQLLHVEEKKNVFERFLAAYLFGDTTPTKYTGYRRPDPRKLTEMIVFFAQSCTPWKTKLNKLLFYSDFSNYRKTGFSISGARYAAIPLGPVPDNFNAIFDFVVQRGAVDVVRDEVDDGAIREQYIGNPGRQFDSDAFTEAELNTLDTVLQRFASMSTTDIVRISHTEQGWKDNQASKSRINYRYGFDLVSI